LSSTNITNVKDERLETCRDFKKD